MTWIPSALRHQVTQRAQSRCEYCCLDQASQAATFPIDHVIPVILKGPTDFSNLALTCPKCNALKWKHVQALDPETGEMVSLFNPRLDRWTDHFRWMKSDATQVEALTSTARATSELLQLNGEFRREIRRWLEVVKRHPPR